MDVAEATECMLMLLCMIMGPHDPTRPTHNHKCVVCCQPVDHYHSYHSYSAFNWQTLPPTTASVSFLQTAIISILIGCFVIMWILVFAGLHQMLSGLNSKNEVKVGNMSEDTTNAALMDTMWIWSGFLGELGGHIMLF
jgi:hypothetical protein